MNIKPNLMGRLRAAATGTFPVHPEVLKALCLEAADEIDLLRAPAGDASDVLNDALAVVWRAQAGKGLDELGGHLLAEMKRRGYVVAVQVRRP